MIPQISLSRALSANLDDVMTVMATAFDPVYGEAWTASQCAGVLAMPGCWLTLARIGGRPVGFSLARAIMDEAELLLIAVSAQEQRNGYGKILLDGVVSDARDLAVRRLFLEVRSGNPAISFYSKAGFARVGLRPNYYRNTQGTLFDAETQAMLIA
jgi:[ribosomal protein S18]-alanine N-acetyltransferase